MTRRVCEQRTKAFMEIGAQAEGKPFKSPGEYPRGPRLLFVPVALLLSALMCGCSNGSSSPSASPINMAGNWQVSATSSKFGTQSRGSGTLAQSGSNISGSLSLTGTPCATSASVSGTLNGQSLNLSLNENGQIVTLTGTVAADGNSASGSYSAPAGGCTNGDTGTWTGTRTSVSGTFSGVLAIPGYTPVGLTMQLRDEGGRVTATGTVSNSTCLSTLVINGSVSGLRVDLTGKDERSRRVRGLRWQN